MFFDSLFVKNVSFFKGIFLDFLILFSLLDFLFFLGEWHRWGVCYFVDLLFYKNTIG